MNIRPLLLAGALMLVFAPFSNAEVKVATELRTGTPAFREIDVIDANGPAPTVATVSNREPVLKSFTAEAGMYQFTIDATDAPDLMEWADTKLRPVVQEWYPVPGGDDDRPIEKGVSWVKLGIAIRVTVKKLRPARDVGCRKVGRGECHLPTTAGG